MALQVVQVGEHILRPTVDLDAVSDRLLSLLPLFTVVKDGLDVGPVGVKDVG